MPWDPKQFTVSKFRLKPVILISECFCSRCGHTNQHPPPTWRETTGDNGRQDHFRAQEADHTNQHPPPTWRETTGDNGRQRETRPLQSPRRRPHKTKSPRSRPHQPTPTPHMKGDNRRQWETTGDKTTSEPKKPTTPTNTKAARSKVALRTPTVNCLGKKNIDFFAFCIHTLVYLIPRLCSKSTAERTALTISTMRMQANLIPATNLWNKNLPKISRESWAKLRSRKLSRSHAESSQEICQQKSQQQQQQQNNYVNLL